MISIICNLMMIILERKRAAECTYIQRHGLKEWRWILDLYDNIVIEAVGYFQSIVYDFPHEVRYEIGKCLADSGCFLL